MSGIFLYLHLIFQLLGISFYFMYMSVLLDICTSHVGPLELKLQMAVNHCVDAENKS